VMPRFLLAGSERVSRLRRLNVSQEVHWLLTFRTHSANNAQLMLTGTIVLVAKTSHPRALVTCRIQCEVTG
jgi:hypothetical protein